MRRGRLAAGLLLAAGMLSAPRARADLLDLETGFPLEVEDAYPIGYLGREAQLHLDYEHTGDGGDALHLVPRLELGFPRNGQITVAQKFIVGSVDPNGVGSTELEFLYAVLQETLVLPAVALAALAELPSGKDVHGVDAGGRLLLTKTIPGTWHHHRVHANALYQANDDVQPGERGSRYQVVVGYSTVVTNELLFVADLVREELFAAGEEHNLVGVGLRWAVAPWAVVSAGVAVGIGDESPDVRPILALQWEF